MLLFYVGHCSDRKIFFSYKIMPKKVRWYINCNWCYNVAATCVAQYSVTKLLIYELYQSFSTWSYRSLKIDAEGASLSGGLNEPVINYLLCSIKSIFSYWNTGSPIKQLSSSTTLWCSNKWLSCKVDTLA